MVANALQWRYIVKENIFLEEEEGKGVRQQGEGDEEGVEGKGGEDGQWEVVER